MCNIATLVAFGRVAEVPSELSGAANKPVDYRVLAQLADEYLELDAVPLCSEC